MNDSEVKARLAQAEVHFSHYRWDDAIATFEAVIAAHPDHPAAAQGWATAVEQKTIDEELGQALDKVRASLTAQRFDEALTTLNHAQARGALSHILKYHSEIDGLRSEAQEGQEWQRRIDAAGREAEALAGRRRFDQALEVLDNTLRPLNGRGWERLGPGLAALRDRLWAERDVSERLQFAQAAYERQDYRLATELAATLHEELPGHDEVKRLHERARGAWGRIQDQLVAVNEALDEGRADDALALLAALRSEHPRNPDWQAIALRVHTARGRQEVVIGRAALVDHGFDEAAEAFERACAAFATTVEIFEGHPTAAREQAEAAALREAALSASQAVRDRGALRWEASRLGWQASRDQLARAIAVRGRDFGEVVVVVDAMLGEAQAALGDLEQARLSLAEGRQALEARDAGKAREAFRSGLARVEGGPWGDAADGKLLREQLEAGLRESERVQREVKKLLSQAEAGRRGKEGGERLRLLHRAYELWETAPGLAAKLADELLAAARESVEAGDEDRALAFCGQVRELTGAPAGALSAGEEMIAGIRGRRDVREALDKASARIDAAGREHLPSANGYAQALALLASAAPALEDVKDLAPEFEALIAQAEDGRDRALAAQPHVAQSEALSKVGDWRGAAAALAAAHAALGPLASSETSERLAQLQAWAEAVDTALAPARKALMGAEAAYSLAADGDLDAVDWDGLEKALTEARKALRRPSGLPSPLPEEWEATRARAEAIARRSKVLRGVQDKVAAGRGAEAIPLLQAGAAPDADPLIAAVLARLLEETSGDAAMLAHRWAAEAVSALGRGEFGTAEGYLELARGYTPGAPQMVPELRRIERQIAALAEVRRATVEAREAAVRGEVDVALVSFRRALELAAGGESGLSGAARRDLRLLVDLEDELGPSTEGREIGAAAAEGEAVVQRLLHDDEAGSLVAEFVAPTLVRWWKLAQRTAGLAHVKAQLTLGRHEAAVRASADLVDAYPRDAAALELYKTVTGRIHERLIIQARRRLDRARRLSVRGDYEGALAVIGAGDKELSLVDRCGAEIELPDELETMAAEAGEMRAELRALQSMSEKLRPLLDQMRDAGSAGQYGQAGELLTRAQFVDPRRRSAIVWDELEALASIMLFSSQTFELHTQTFGVSETPKVSPHGQTAPTAVVPTQTSEAHAEIFDVSETPKVSPHGQTAPTSLVPTQTSEVHAQTFGVSETPKVSQRDEVPAPAEGRAEPPAPFDLDDWLSNLTELESEDGGPEVES